LELNPVAESHNGLAALLIEQGHLDEALRHCRRALDMKPDYAKAHANLGTIALDEGRAEKAIGHYQRAIACDAALPEPHLGLALAWLTLGDYRHGFAEFQWRWQVKPLQPRPFVQPLWDGRPLQGQTILLHAEQGLGDTLQFIRYASLVRERGGRVIVECQPSLRPLLRAQAQAKGSAWGVEQLVDRGRPLPAFDVHAPLASLPGIFQTTPESIPHHTPYLFAAAPLVAKWRDVLRPIEGFKVGICWQGCPGYRSDRWRSIPLRHFAPLAAVPGVRLISLQKESGTAQLAALAGRFNVIDFGLALDERSGAFMDTAAMMMSLDLVITSDTAVAHLAGALGVPVWVALPLAADWRWLQQRRDSPWYPGMQLFRQAIRGDWPTVFNTMAAALRQRVE
jgi:hypothetical protein